jgi:hypothetical protein
MKITNNSGISLPLAVWLAHDEYDYVEGVENYISATTLMKPLRQIVLAQRIPYADRRIDVADLIASSLGSAIHVGVERAWTLGYQRSLKLMGYPQAVIERVAINPTDKERLLNSAMIPVYLEQREMRQIDGFTVGGKFDMVTEGIVNDTKSTSVWTVIKGSRDDDHRLQMSIYRWLDAGREHRRITEDYGRINYVFTDWSKMMLRTPNYPQSRVATKEIPLLSLADTEAWIRAKLALVRKHWTTPEQQLPECTDEELWRDDPKYKYYADPTKTDGRSTRNFDSLVEANEFMFSKGGKGVVKTVLGEPKACSYCAVFDVCTQKDKYYAS